MTGSYHSRRERVLTQVISRWTGVDYDDDADVNLKAIAAADETYRHGICDLDWEAATLARLKTCRAPTMEEVAAVIAPDAGEGEFQ
jgi:hypothetical protein